MAQKLRTAKSASDWQQNELDAYHISLQEQDAETFFDMPELPDPVVINNEVLDLEFAQQDDATTVEGYEFLNALRLVETNVDATNEMTVDALASAVFRVCCYISIGRSIIPNMGVRLAICGEQRFAQANLYFLDNHDFILLVQENKTLKASAPYLDAQLIAEAIAAFCQNNRKREAMGLPPHNNMVIPAITIKGQLPTFYKIPVSVNLAHAVLMGEYIAAETIVCYHTPGPHLPVEIPDGGGEMVNTLNWMHIFRCYEAFRQIVNTQRDLWNDE